MPRRSRCDTITQNSFRARTTMFQSMALRIAVRCKGRLSIFKSIFLPKKSTTKVIFGDDLRPKRVLHKHCFQFLLGPFSNSQGNAYAKCWGDKQRALRYVLVFSVVVNCFFSFLLSLLLILHEVYFHSIFSFHCLFIDSFSSLTLLR